MSHTVVFLLLGAASVLLSRAAADPHCNLTTAEVVANLTGVGHHDVRVNFTQASLAFAASADLVLPAEKFIAGASVAAAQGPPCTLGFPCTLRGSADSLCQTRYNCSYDVNRFPQYLCRADCAIGCSYCPPGYECEPHYVKMPVLYLKNVRKCDFIELSRESSRWEVALEDIGVSCACIRKKFCPIK